MREEAGKPNFDSLHCIYSIKTVHELLTKCYKSRVIFLGSPSAFTVVYPIVSSKYEATSESLLTYNVYKEAILLFLFPSHSYSKSHYVIKN